MKLEKLCSKILTKKIKLVLSAYIINPLTLHARTIARLLSQKKMIEIWLPS